MASDFRVCRVLLAALLMLLASGCQRVVFEHPPAAAGCDSRLAGQWDSVDEPPAEPSPDVAPAELQVEISADCGLRLWMQEKSATRLLEPTQLHTARIDRRDYLWVDAGWANRNFGVELGPLDDRSGVYVFRYKLNNQHIELHGTPAKMLAPKVLDDSLDGDLYLREHDLTVRISGDADTSRAALKTVRRKSDSDPLRFRRAPSPQT